MATLKKGSIAAPALAQEEVEVPSLGGTLMVRALPLTALAGVMARARTNPEASLPALLAVTVLDADGQQFWSEQEWDLFAGGHLADAVKLHQAAQRVCGLDTEGLEKNSESDPSAASSSALPATSA